MVRMVGELRWAVPEGQARFKLGLVLLLQLHAPVLEPDLDLPLCEAQGVRDLYPPPAGQVAVKMELLLQLKSLVARVLLAVPLSLCGRVEKK